MATFPPSFLEEIRAQLPLSGLVGSRVRLIRAGREYKACCPFHNEKSPSFYVNDAKQFFHCFGCGAHGDVIGFAMRHDRLSFPEAVESLAAQAGLQMPRDTPLARESFDKEKRLFQLLESATLWFEAQLFAPTGREALTYLRGRGLSDDAIRRFRLGSAPQDAQALLRDMARQGYERDELAEVGLAKKAEDRDDFYSFFRNRVIFPVGDRRGRTVAFGARILGVGEPKYLNSPDHVLFHKGHLLYGLSRARTSLMQGQPIIVVEGYMDVIALVEGGYSGAVAPLGTALTEEQMQTLWKLAPPVESRVAGRDYSPVLCFDGDQAGLRAAARAVERALPLLTASQTLRIATMTGAKDPDELIRQSGKSAFDSLLKQAQPLSDVLWNLTLAGRTIRTPEERSSFTTALKQKTSQIKDEALRALYHEEFRRRIDTTFGWKPPSIAHKQTGWQNGWKKGQTPVAPFLGSRRSPMDGRRMMERILLALILNHPDLFDAFGESLAHLDCQTPAYEGLRQRILDALAQDALTPEELRRHLHAPEESVFQEDHEREIIDEILSPETYAHARAARPEASTEEARQAWLSVWERLAQEGIRSDYAAACAAYRADPSESNRRRMEALREKIMDFQA